jgi:hypothetical protein
MSDTEGAGTAQSVQRLATGSTAEGRSSSLGTSILSSPRRPDRPPLWSSSQQFLATDPEVLGSIPGASRFSEKPRVWNGVHSAS